MIRMEKGIKYYYYAEKGSKFGPLTIEELKNKRLKKSTLIWTEGMESWKPAKTIDELKNFLISEPPPLPNEESEQIFKVPKVKKYPSQKYDITYEKERKATVMGILLLIAPIIYFWTNSYAYDTKDEFLYLNMPSFIIFGLLIRIFATIWIVKIASKQNRDSVTWGWFSFFFPSIALIIIGQLKKFQLKNRNR